MATRKMNAAVVEHFGKPLVLREWDIPTPGVGQIVVKTEACEFATPTSTPQTGIGRSSPPFRLFPATKPSAWSPQSEQE